MTRRMNGDRESGFTLVELMVTMVIGGVLAAISIFGFNNYRYTSEHQGSAQELVSSLRAASELAISEGRTYCVDTENAVAPAVNRAYSTWRYACGAGGAQVGGTRKTQSAQVSMTSVVANPATPPPCPANHGCLYFYPRGTALPATVVMASTQRSTRYTIHVEGLTARVYM
ncbi:MAG: GspH/FimT family pseudopilin [Actinomycetota bacterium]|nr:GspH/FimT family pseudopilin [Actinomycetota bacterium]